jgi:hypothetical protein
MQQLNKTNRIPRLLVFVGIFMLAAGILSFLKYDTRIISYLVAFSSALLFVALYLKFAGKEELIKDERSNKVKWLATSYSWWATFVLIALLMLILEFQLAALSIESVLGLTFFFMVASQYFFIWILNRKANLE